MEDLVIKLKNKTNYGPERLSDYLLDYENIKISYGTIRHILARNKDKLTKKKRHKVRRGKREFVDWYSAKAFEIVQIDLKHIRDKKALSKDQMIHLDKFNIPNYQWSALDVNSRFKLIAYSREKSWTNGLMFFLWITSWLRSYGVKCEIVYTVDNGEEFGGKSWLKVKELKKLLKSLGCKLIQNHKGHCEENAHVERSHLTDDTEFYCLRTQYIKSADQLCSEAMKYVYYYNNVRRHSSINKQTPASYLLKQKPYLNDKIRLVRPIMLDSAAVKLGPWSGYNVLAQDRNFTVSLGLKEV